MTAPEGFDARDGQENAESELQTRLHQIVRLLEASYDHLPEVTRRDHTLSGFVHNTVAPITCPDCLANDHISFSCESCHGRGTIDEQRERDPYAINEDAPTPRYGMDGTKHDARRERDAQIARLEQQVREPWKSADDELADANRHPEGWEIARARAYAKYDHAAIDQAMEKLRIADHDAHQALTVLYVHGRLWNHSEARTKFERKQPWQIEPGEEMLDAVARGLAFVEVRMPAKIRVPKESGPAVNLAARGRHADKTAMSQRNDAIRAASADGLTVPEIVARFGLKKSAVYEVLNGEAA